MGDTVAEGGEDGQAPAGQEGAVRGTLVRDSRRKRPRGDEPLAVAKLQRSEEEEEEEEQVAKSRKAPGPPENILGEPEEEEKSRATPRARWVLWRGQRARTRAAFAQIPPFLRCFGGNK